MTEIFNKFYLEKLEQNIHSQKKELDRWLHECYGDKYGFFYGENDIAYKNWGVIENVLAIAFEKIDLSILSKKCLDDILFFISRSDEGGRIIAWLSPSVPQLSNIADLTENNFISLCKHALSSNEDYCDYQLTNCFNKFDVLGPEFECLLLNFFQREGVYTKRIALSALTNHHYKDLEPLITKLWNIDDEWAKLGCLESLKKSKCNNLLYEEYKSILSCSKDDNVVFNVHEIEKIK